MKLITFALSLLAGIALAQAPIPLIIDSRAPTAQEIAPYQASRTVYRITFMDGTNHVSLAGLSGWMSWSTNSYAVGISTASIAVVDSLAGIVDATFTATSMNYTPGRYIYEVGLRGSGGITVYRQGILTLRGSPYAAGVPAAAWTTNSVNWGLINWTGLPTTLAGYGIVGGVDLTALLGVSNQTVAAQADIDAHELLTGTNVHGLKSAATNPVTYFATAAQGTKADTALQSEADTNAIAQLNTHAGLTGTNAHGLGSASTASTNAFATFAQGAKADTALQHEADTNALAQLVVHTNKSALVAHSGLGSASTSAATAFATAAQGLLAASALQSEADTNALAQLNARVILQAATNTGFESRITANNTGKTTLVTFYAYTNAQANTNAGFESRIVAVETGKQSLAAQTATNSGFQALHTAQAASNTVFLGWHNAQAATNAAFQALHTAQANTNASLQSQITANGTNDTPLASFYAYTNAQANTNAAFQALHTAQAASNTAMLGWHTAQAASNTTFLGWHTAQANTNLGFETRIVLGETAYGWGDWSGQGFITSATNRFNDLTIADLSKLATNQAGLTAGAYTGVVGSSISFTGVTHLIAGYTYAWGYYKSANGTSTLSIAGQSLAKTTAGNVSNYFTYSGSDTNLILKLDGTDLSLCTVSNLYLRAVTNGDIAAAGNVYVRGKVYSGGNEMVSLTGTPVYAESDPAFTNFAYTNTVQSQITSLNTQKVDRVDTNGWTVTSHAAWITNEPAFTNFAYTNTVQSQITSLNTQKVDRVDTNGWTVTSHAAWITNEPAFTNFAYTNTLQTQITGNTTGKVDRVDTNGIIKYGATGYVFSVTGTSPVSGAITFNGSGVGQTGNVFTFSGGGGGEPLWIAASNKVVYTNQDMVFTDGSTTYNIGPEAGAPNMIFRIKVNNSSPDFFTVDPLSGVWMNSFYGNFTGTWYNLGTNAFYPQASGASVSGQVAEIRANSNNWTVTAHSAWIVTQSVNGVTGTATNGMAKVALIDTGSWVTNWVIWIGPATSQPHTNAGTLYGTW